MEIDTEAYLAGLREKSTQNKVEYEFQELGLELEALLGKENKKKIWPLFFTPGNNELKVREAIRQFKERRFGYFMWLLKNVK